MRLEQLNYLVAIAQCGSINKASEKLFVSQPAISTAIHSLEKELGVPLLERTKTGTQPTDYGLKVIRDTNDILHTMGRWGDLSEIVTGKSVTRIMYFTEFCSQPLYQFYFLMKRLHPELELRLTMNRRTLYEIDTDDAILHTCSSDGLDKILYNKKNRYKVTLLYEEPFCLYVSAEHMLSKQDQVHLSDIAGMTIAGKDSRKSFPFRQYLRELNCQMIYLGQNENVMRGVLHNECVAIMPASAANDNIYISSGYVKRLHITDISFPFYHYMLSSLDRTFSSDENVVINCLRVFYGDIMNGHASLAELDETK